MIYIGAKPVKVSTVQFILILFLPIHFPRPWESLPPSPLVFYLQLFQLMAASRHDRHVGVSHAGVGHQRGASGKLAHRRVRRRVRRLQRVRRHLQLVPLGGLTGGRQRTARWLGPGQRYLKYPARCHCGRYPSSLARANPPTMFPTPRAAPLHSSPSSV